MDIFFKAESMGLNSQGGVSYEMIKSNDDNTMDSVFIWYETRDEVDVCPKNFNSDKLDSYELFIQVEIDDGADIEVFHSADEAVDFYRNSKI